MPLSPTNHPPVTAAAVEPEMADDVIAYCEHHGLTDLFDQAITLTRDVFPTLTRLTAKVGFDPDSADDWVILKAFVAGRTPAIEDAFQRYATQWVRIAPQEKQFQIRLSPRAA